jgi:hypothetical protein
MASRVRQVGVAGSGHMGRRADGRGHRSTVGTSSAMSCPARAVGRIRRRLGGSRNSPASLTCIAHLAFDSRIAVSTGFCQALRADGRLPFHGPVVSGWAINRPESRWSTSQIKASRASRWCEGDFATALANRSARHGLRYFEDAQQLAQRQAYRETP